MLEVVSSNRFKRDLKLAIRRGYNIELLTTVINQLAAGKTLAAKYQDHALTGNYGGFRECHITPDWLLIYQIQEDALVLFLSRIGTHSDLFS